MNRGGEINLDFRSWFHTSHTALELRSGYSLFGYNMIFNNSYIIGVNILMCYLLCFFQ
jgi:hypothetical protein